MVQLYCGDCLKEMEKVPDHSVDLSVMDPPYSSGGMFRSDRNAPTNTKYTNTQFKGASRFKNFTGDSMDSWALYHYWGEVFSRIADKLKIGGVAASFVDWRNIAVACAALQVSGLVYRGIVVWDKGTSRATPDRFRNDCEYVVWGTMGPRKAAFVKGVKTWPGCYHVKSVPSAKKHHQTEKPVELMEDLIQICPEGGTVMDCFMGSGSTGVACQHLHRNFIGIEKDADYFKVAQQRIAEAADN